MNLPAVGIPLNIQEGERYVAIWVYGDGSGNTLVAPVHLTDGSSSEQILTVLNFTGWQQIITPLPSGADQILTLKVMPTGANAAGTIWLDQVTTSNQYVSDLTPPVVTVTLSENTLSATLQDDIDKDFSAQQIAVTYGRPAAVLRPERGVGHRIAARTGRPGSPRHGHSYRCLGNIGRASADIAASDEREETFGDMAGHWAKDYVNYLYDQEISNGVAVGEEFHFQPDKNITRGEFSLMVARWLRLDLTQYSSVELPFADKAAIPDWCLDAVKAMYVLGVSQGRPPEMTALTPLRRGTLPGLKP